MPSAEVGTTEPHRDLGQKLKHVRSLQALRLKDVAERAGCSESLLSKIENGKAAPSLLMLHRITEALGTTVAACFSDPDAEPLTVYRPGERPTIHLGSSESRDVEPSLERLTPYIAGRALNANLHVVPPGAGSDGALKHAGEEVGFVIEGSVELTVDGRTVVVVAGGSFFFRSALPHSYRNTGTETARIVWVNTPPY
jgi:transcriptional regulator with XRE-family HTH domain